MGDKVVRSLIIMISFNSLVVAAENFGYLSYDTQNIGDDIQSLAARQFLPSERQKGVLRDAIGHNISSDPVNLIMNGWWMHKMPASGQVSWPPRDAINPLLISMHITHDAAGGMLTDQGAAYLRKFGPVGARDTATYNLLKDNNVPTYFSGCLTLTLNNDQTTRDQIGYVVDLDDEVVDYIQSRVPQGTVVETLTHIFPKEFSLDQSFRLSVATELLEKYKRAKFVVTSRLHAAMPNLAFKTPILMINTQWDQYRFDGLRELVISGSKEDLLAGKIDFDFNNPAPNSDAYLPLRDALIARVQEFVNHPHAVRTDSNQSETD